MGPKTEPWGTPHDECNMREKDESEATAKDLLERKSLLRILEILF